MLRGNLSRFSAIFLHFFRVYRVLFTPLWLIQTFLAKDSEHSEVDVSSA